jgi:hypothetical protein
LQFYDYVVKQINKQNGVWMQASDFYRLGLKDRQRTANWFSKNDKHKIGEYMLLKKINDKFYFMKQ